MANRAKNIIRLIGVPGLKGRSNDLILSRAHCDPPESLVIFFHGDIQDYPEKMSRSDPRYYHWNLDNTAQLLAGKFNYDVVMTVKASRINFKAFFNNFANYDKFGEPIFEENTDPLAHLKALISQASKMCNWFNQIRSIKLVGFSQGMSVVNQLIYSMYALESKNDPQLQHFVSLIKHIYWLDGGKCWLTDENILKTLVHHSIMGHVFVTPFQVSNPTRPENETNFNIFKSLLDKLGINYVYNFYYENLGPSIDRHFQLLQDFEAN